GHPEAAPYVHFLTGREASIKALTSAVGFRYAYDAQIDQFAHPAALTLLTGEGRVSRYLYGIEFAPRDLKLALVEASEGKIGSVVEQILLFCYHYDPESGKYGLVIINFVRLAAALTVIALGASVFLSLRRDRRRSPRILRLPAPCSPQAPRRWRWRWICSISSSAPCARFSPCWSRRWS